MNYKQMRSVVRGKIIFFIPYLTQADYYLLHGITAAQYPKVENVGCFDWLLRKKEQGLVKPDKEIFYRCLQKLSVKAEECLYVGDGGSQELETAKALGMRAVQAVWYLQEGTEQPSGRKPAFRHMETPLAVMQELQ
jgi:FMN phosphatase YigB (HAD superfamily)